MAKVFISHHRHDSATALTVSQRLLNPHGITSYLDVIDDKIAGNGEDLVAYLKNRMSTCSNLIAVVSPTTKLSQWVPWEIGVASERNMPLAAYLSGINDVPEFLKRWPRLSSVAHVDAYAAAMKMGERTVLQKRASRIDESASLRAGAADFYTELRRTLGQ